MRLIIDLQAFQYARAWQLPAMLELLAAIVRDANQTGVHVLALLNLQTAQNHDAIRQALLPLLPAEQILGYSLPTAGKSKWELASQLILREHFRAQLQAEAIYLPYLPHEDNVADTSWLPLYAFETADLHDPACTEFTLPILLQPMVALGAPESAPDFTLTKALQSPRLRLLPTPHFLHLESQDAQHSGSASKQASDAELAKAAQEVLQALQALATDLRQPAKTIAQHQAISAFNQAQLGTPIRLPRLAYVSPLPPKKSGIADYSVELIPELAKYFDVDLIVDQESVHAPALGQHYPLRDIAWFEKNAHLFPHVLYHFGNSPAHQHMFALAERFPGVIVLHDFYLGNILHHLGVTDYLPHAFTRALYQSHGYSALLAQGKMGVKESIWHYPCNKPVLDAAKGVIVHSAYPAALARQWYGADYARDWQVLPLIRGQKGLSHYAQDRQEARQQLGWTDADFVVCSYGMLGRTKNNQLLLQAWLASPLAHNPHCHLIFVGANDEGEYGTLLQQQINAAKTSNHIRITGFVSHDDYHHWLLAADVAVQLRCNSRGETSAAVLDCLLYGVPSIVNAHGANAELPADVLCQLPDACSVEQLQVALEQLHQDADLRQQLREAGRAYIAREHAPDKVGALYQQALLAFANDGKHVVHQRCIAKLAQLSMQQEVAVTDVQWASVANCLAHNHLPQAPRQLLIDISAMVQTDLKTGIQRVVRSILLALLAAPPEGYRIEPVFTIGQGQPYHYARTYMQKLLDCAAIGLEDSPMLARQGDVFLGLDLFMGGTSQNRPLLDAMHQRGVQIYFVVYDILPVLRPDVFPVEAEADFAQWLNHIASVSDGLLCISRAVADQAHAWLSEHKPQRVLPLQFGYFHLGADIDASAPSSGMPEDAAQILGNIEQRPSILMVGTVEPRKGHAQALAAFDLLWQQGLDVNLVIVGKQGWMVEQLAERLQQHPERRRRLFWLAGVSDEMLLKLYQNCSCLLAASEGEGFGLPLIEAAQHGLPIIARQLPVFEEVMADFGYYFDGLHAEVLAQAISAWLALQKQGKAPQSRDMPWLTWQQSAEQLSKAIFKREWYRQLEL